MEQNKAGPQTAEWWVKRIADSCIQDRIMATDYYKKNKTSKHDSLCWALNDVVSGDEIPDIRAKYFSPDHTTASHTDWVKEEAKLLPVGEPQQDLSVDKLIGTSTAIHCPTKKEWDTVYGLLKKTGKYEVLIEDCWKNYQEKSCIICNSTYDRVVYCQSQGYPIVQAKDVIAANQLSTGYKVGDWITILNGGCRVGPGMQGHTLVGNSYQISSVGRQTPTEWKYTLEGNPAQTSAIVWDRATMGSQPYIRPATSEEIAKATQSTEGWKVGDKLPDKWVNKQMTYVPNGPGRWKQHCILYGAISGDKVVKEVKNGYAAISDTNTCWLPPKHLCTPLPTESKEWVPKVGEWVVTTSSEYNYTEGGQRGKIGTVYQIKEIFENGNWYRRTRGVSDGAKITSLRPATPEEIRKAQSKNGKEWICTSEDGVELYDGDRVQWVIRSTKELTPPTSITTNHSMKDVQRAFALFSTEQAAKEWIARQSSPQQVPVTADNAYVGMKVVRGKDWDWGDGHQLPQGITGEITLIYDYYTTKDRVTVKWSTGQNRYSIGNNKYDLYIAPEEKSTSKSIINSQTKTKNNEKDRNKAVYVCRDHQIISKPERRTATPVSGGGCTGLIKGAHKVHRKAISCL